MRPIAASSISVLVILALSARLTCGGPPPGSATEFECHTFSIAAIDAEEGECGAAVTTRVPQVGIGVPWVRAGVGAVLTQAQTQTRYGPLGLDLMEEGVAPADAIERMLEGDVNRELRQLGLINMKGQTANFTGAKTSAFAGARVGTHYTVQGNLLTGREVIDAVADSLEETEQTDRTLADRLILALEAGQRAGGDKRKGLLQSAAILVASTSKSGRIGNHVPIDIRVAEHPTPVKELRRQYDTIYQRLGHRSFHVVSGRDVLELKRMLHSLGFFRAGEDKLPSVLDDSGLRIFDLEAADAVDAFRHSVGLPVMADRLGHPRGLVDAPLVEALREAYDSRPRDD